MALNLPPDWIARAHPGQASPWRDLVRARDEQGWDVHAVSDLAQLEAFARAFSRGRYGDAGGGS